MSFTRLLIASALVAAGVGVVLTPSGVRAATAADRTEYQIIADTAHGHLYIAQDNQTYPSAILSGSSTVVTNLSGKPVATLPGPYTRDDMALSPDGGSLYIGVSGGVDVYSTATLAQTGFYSINSDFGTSAAYGVVTQSGLLWVSYSLGGPGAYEVGTINPSTGTFTEASLPETWVGGPPAIASDPTNKGVIVTSSVGITAPTVSSFNVSNPAAVSVNAQSTSIGDCEAAHQLTAIPGGTSFFCSGIIYSTSDLSEVAMPNLEPGLAVYAANGTGAYVDLPGAATGASPDAWILPPGVTDLSHYKDAYTLPNSASDFVSDLAWSANASTLFTAVQQTDSAGNDLSYTVRTIDTRLHPRLTITSNANPVGYDGKATITAHLGSSGTNRRISIYATRAGGTRTLLKAGTVNSAGNLVTTHTLTRSTRFTAAFSGDDQYQPATVTTLVGARVQVRSVLGGYYRSTHLGRVFYRVYHHTATLRDSVVVTPNKHRECVDLQVQRYYSHAWHPGSTSKCSSLNSTSRVTLSHRLGITGQFRVRVNYLRSAQDTTNVSTSGGWLYYKVVR